MATTAETPQSGFRLGMLIYDTRYRSITIQIVVVLLCMAAAAWLIDNLFSNLADRGKDLSFSFLWNRAGYDINQTLIPYSNDDTHFRALLVGLVNTILVSVLGCIVNGPGESKHADIGISLPGTGEAPAAPVFVEGKKVTTLRGPGASADFKRMVLDYIERRFGRDGLGRDGLGPDDLGQGDLGQETNRTAAE